MSTAPSTSTFWGRIGLNDKDKLRCMTIVRGRYSQCQVQENKEQGYCSFTLLISARYDIPSSTYESRDVISSLDLRPGQSLIVQLRPIQHALDMEIARAAKKTYSSLAPNIVLLDLQLPGQLCLYEMERMPGTPLSRVLPRNVSVDSTSRKKQERLIESFAKLMARSWQCSIKTFTTSRNARADSPMNEMPIMLSKRTGKVGSSIIHRMEKLGRELPGTPLKERAKYTLARTRALNDFAVVLNHGDLIPSNILVDEDTWEITGLVDWAEAEYLPFGTCLYGLEHFLGYLAPATEDITLARGDPPSFVYYNHAAQLRELFWTRLFALAPDLETRQDDVRTMRDLGVLLWYGYAWDDGAINRVVNETDDVVELACTRAFLDVI
jgi:hypothetical protein